MKTFFEKNPVLLLQWATIGVFAGRAYQHLFWDAPYREVIWDPDLSGPFLFTVVAPSLAAALYLVALRPDPLRLAASWRAEQAAESERLGTVPPSATGSEHRPSIRLAVLASAGVVG